MRCSGSRAASAFGNLFSDLTSVERDVVLGAVSRALGRLGGPSGIRLRRNVIFAVGVAGAQDSTFSPLA